MPKTASLWVPHLQRAHSSRSGTRLTRRIPGADVVQGYIVGVGRKWVLLAQLSEVRLDGFTAVRLRDVTRLQPLPSEDFPRKVAESTGTWPPVAPDPAFDLDRTSCLLATARKHATLVGLHIEDEDPELAFFGVPTRCADGQVHLLEVTAQAAWDGTRSTWRTSEITRIDFGGTYACDLLMVAGPPPAD